MNEMASNFYLVVMYSALILGFGVCPLAIALSPSNVNLDKFMNFLLMVAIFTIFLTCLVFCIQNIVNFFFG